MLTRLKVSGFKNLVDVDVRFGPFTCVAGANGVGKSNLFDAIKFLSALADLPLIEAALSVRDESGKTGDIRSLFHRIGDNYDSEMSFDAEIVIAEEGVDDLGQIAKASITFLRYSVKLAYRGNSDWSNSGALELIEEKLVHINLGDATKNLLFNHKRNWRQSAIKGRRGSAFISTEFKDGNRIIKLHQDGQKGKPLSRLAANLPRTVLSVANAAESPTALLARREMQSWQLLQLEPSAVRKPDEFTNPSKLQSDGSHLAATLYRLACGKQNTQVNGSSPEELKEQVYAQVANRLAQLLDDIDQVWVDKDDRRQLLTLMVKQLDGTTHPARSLSDGTLRFLALAVLELDPQVKGLICLEEPENGIHPERIPKILTLLKDIAVDVEEPIDQDNPLRQVIINTHSPVVVQEVPENSLLIAELKEMVQEGERFKTVCFSCLADTWRAKDTNVVSKGKLLSYLNPVPIAKEELDTDIIPTNESKFSPSSKGRVIDREDMQQLSLF